MKIKTVVLCQIKTTEMEDFKLFDDIMKECGKTQIECKSSKPVKKTCSHKDTFEDGGITQCLDCGEQFSSIESKDALPTYGTAQTVSVLDPTRCQKRKSDERSIFKDVENMGFPDSIVRLANSIYLDNARKYNSEVKDSENFNVHRGTNRKALIFASIYSAYKISTPKSIDELIKPFGIDKKAGQNGIKCIQRNISKKSPIRTTYIRPYHLIDETMDKFNATKDQKLEAIEIFKRIDNRSSVLLRSKPQSVAAAVVYHWIKKTNKNISIQEFSSKVGLSGLTITKKEKEISRLMDEIETEEHIIELLGTTAKCKIALAKYRSIENKHLIHNKSSPQVIAQNIVSSVSKAPRTSAVQIASKSKLKSSQKVSHISQAAIIA